MPLIDIACPDCGHKFEFQRPLKDYPNVPPCESCQSTNAVQYHPEPRARWMVDPVVVFRAPDGSYRFPGDAAGASAAGYAREGFERVELRGAAEVRHFEKRMNKIEYERLARRVEIQHRHRERMDAARSSEVRHGMEQGFLVPEVGRDGKATGRMRRVHLSERGRELMRRAQQTTAERPQPRAYDTGFHVDVYSNDRSNREESRDSSGRRRRD